MYKQLDRSKKIDIEALVSLPEDERRRLIMLAASMMANAPTSAWEQGVGRDAAQKQTDRTA